MLPDSLQFRLQATRKVRPRDERTSELDHHRSRLECEKFRHVGRLRHIAANAGNDISQLRGSEPRSWSIQNDISAS